MAGLIEDMVSGVVKSAMSEILKKTKGTQSRRGKRRAAKSQDGGLLGSILEAALGKPQKAPRKPARKQVSKRKTSTSRSKQRS